MASSSSYVKPAAAEPVRSRALAAAERLFLPFFEPLERCRRCRRAPPAAARSSPGVLAGDRPIPPARRLISTMSSAMPLAASLVSPELLLPPPRRRAKRRLLRVLPVAPAPEDDAPPSRSDSPMADGVDGWVDASERDDDAAGEADPLWVEKRRLTNPGRLRPRLPC